MANISPSRCETKTTETPCALSVSMVRKSTPTWSSVSELVGSSRMSTRASMLSARAISTICCRSGDRLPVSCSGSIGSRSRSSTSAALARVADQSMPNRPPTSRLPSRMFSATVRAGASAVSWETIAMPCAMASSGRWNCTGSPPMPMLPESGSTWPERMPSIVDLPEPFSPISPWTTPGRLMVSDAPRSAWMPP